MPLFSNKGRISCVLYPVYTIQPVVKPGCTTGLTTGLTTVLNEQPLFVQLLSNQVVQEIHDTAGCQTGCQTGCAG